MLGYVAKRCLWIVPTLIGITFCTFLMMDLAPGDAASQAFAAATAEGPSADAASRAQALHRLRVHYGLVDPQTGEPRPLLVRYAEWLRRAAVLRLAGPGEDQQHFRRRILDALPVTMLVNLLALVMALAIALPLGSWLGMHARSRRDRLVSTVLFLLYGMPQFLLATLLLLLLGGVLLPAVLPASGLRSEGSAAWSPSARALDLAAHLVLPVLTLAIGPCVVLSRFLRESVARARQSEFVLALRGWGMSERVIRRRALRNGLSPLVTLLGTLVPMLVGGSVVVESVFSLPGMGQLAWSAVGRRDQAMVMALTLLVALVTLLGLLLSDLLQRAVDPRVELR